MKLNSKILTYYYHIAFEISKGNAYIFGGLRTNLTAWLIFQCRIQIQSIVLFNLTTEVFSFKCLKVSLPGGFQSYLTRQSIAGLRCKFV